MQTPDIATQRLRLIAITPQLLNIQEQTPPLLAKALKAELPLEWPGNDWEPHVYTFMREQFAAHPYTIGWHRYVLLPQTSAPVQTSTLIGWLGSHPLGIDEAEFGYSILEPWQNRGYATEAARALLNHLFQCGRRRIRAQTYPHLPASLRVMQKCGMSHAGPGDDPDAICYAIEL
jgi:[ribosomal protein S5]-alanine N-acetyltransferase